MASNVNKAPLALAALLLAAGSPVLAQDQLVRIGVSGPLSLYHITKGASDQGWDAFWLMIALISINLGLINLLPIPICRVMCAPSSAPSKPSSPAAGTALSPTLQIWITRWPPLHHALEARR